MRGSEFIHNSVQLLYYKCHKVNFKRVCVRVCVCVCVCVCVSVCVCRGVIYWFSSLDKNKKATINPKNEDDKCFKYAATVALSYKNNECNPERVSNIVPFISKYNWYGKNYSSKLDDWKRFEKNNPTVAPNILSLTEKEMYQAYISNNNSTWDEQIILLIISNKENEK